MLRRNRQTLSAGALRVSSLDSVVRYKRLIELVDDRRWEVKTPVTVDSTNEPYNRLRTSRESFIPSRARRGSTATERSSYASISSPEAEQTGKR